jgi:hypothetical protein
MLFPIPPKGEYWKVKSGIFGSKLDSADIASDPDKDSLEENSRKTKELVSGIRYGLKYSSLSEKDAWEFLHKTGKYNYSLAGGIRVNGEMLTSSTLRQKRAAAMRAGCLLLWKAMRSSGPTTDTLLAKPVKISSCLAWDLRKMTLPVPFSLKKGR